MQRGQLRMQLFYFNMNVITFAQIIYQKCKTSNIYLEDV